MILGSNNFWCNLLCMYLMKKSVAQQNLILFTTSLVPLSSVIIIEDVKEAQVATHNNASVCVHLRLFIHCFHLRRQQYTNIDCCEGHS